MKITNLCMMTFALISMAVQPAVSAELPYGYPTTERTKLKINDNWRFKLGGADEKNYLPETDDSKWEQVAVPHTLKLTSINLDGCQDDKSQPTFHREVGWYRRNITPSNSSKRVILEFEGVHQVATLWVNGRKVGVHGTSGYTPFEFDITDYVKRGAENQITILADNRVSLVAPPDPGMFDYVHFSGLYRDVYLTETAKMYITPNIRSAESGVTITTPSVDYINGNATIDIRTEVCNESDNTQDLTILQRVVDAEGNVVLKMEQSAEVEAGDTFRFVQTGGIEDNVKFWSPESPYLYKVNTLLIDGDGNEVDVVDNRLGLRKIEYSHERGFIINGKETEIIGFNRHQHYGFIGDAMPNSLHYRDMIQFKMYGFNAMRTAHYPQDDEILKACDELGILVYEEAPTWISISDEKEWWRNFESAARTMVRNHKNSPSVFIWGAGVNHRGAVGEVQFTIKQEDPTRLTASQSSRWTGWQNSSWTDIFANMMYGDGLWDRTEPLFAMEGRRGAEAVAPYKKDPRMTGLLAWTAHAYYTFHGNSKAADRTRAGIMDSFRYPKEKCLFWYPSELIEAPYIYVLDNWKADLKQLTVYSNADEIELIQNGESTGRYTPSELEMYDGLSAAPFHIENPEYKSSTLTVKGYRDGELVATTEVHTPESATQLRLVADQYDIDFVADNNDILVVHAEVVDDNGTKIDDYKGEISFAVKGDATVVGDGTDIRSNPVNITLGKGSALIRSGAKAGKVKITASSKGLKSSTIEVNTVEPQLDMMSVNAYPIHDNETLLVDLGGKGQLTQFGWTAVIGQDQAPISVSVLQNKLGDLTAGNTPSDINSAEVVEDGTKGAYKISLSGVSNDGVIRWLGEMNVIGKNGFVYGDGVLCIDKSGLKLTLEGLPAGNYRLVSYHHAPSSNTNSMDPNRERLQSENINKLPYAKSLSIAVDGKEVANGIAVTSGKEQQYKPACTSEVSFTSNGKSEIVFKSEDQISGIWLNGFELVREL